MMGSRILVLGASSAIGAAVVRAVAGPGDTVAAHYGAGLGRVEALADCGAEIIPVQADLADPAQLAAMLDWVADMWGCPDKIAHLPSPKLVFTRFKDLVWDDVAAHLDVGVRSAFETFSRFLPLMAKNRYGRVVVVLSSCTVGVPPASMAQYVTAKYALLGLVRAAAAEYVAKGVTVNAVSPSMVETPLLSQVPEKLVELAAEAHPLGRNALPGDVAPLVRLLLSDEAAYMNGLNIPVTGGVRV
ncbi:MAG: SDR family NAD(P)-dependent oxidoreductase [Desulfovibrionaceae bacterium]